MISLVKILNEAIGKPKAIILAGAPGEQVKDIYLED